MGMIQSGWQFIKHSRYANKVQNALLFILEHTEKKCAYCDRVYGAGLNVPVADIMKHMKEYHPDKVSLKEVDFFIKAFP